MRDATPEGFKFLESEYWPRTDGPELYIWHPQCCVEEESGVEEMT